jgi:hypothetical protein
VEEIVVVYLLVMEEQTPVVEVVVQEVRHPIVGMEETVVPVL